MRLIEFSFRQGLRLLSCGMKGLRNVFTAFAFL